MSNRSMWDGKRERFYEVWDASFTHEPSGRGFWLRYTLLNPSAKDNPRHGGLWFATMDVRDRIVPFGVHRYFCGDDVRFSRNHLSLQFGTGRFEEGMLSGSLEQDDHEISWELEYTPSNQPINTVTRWINRVPTIDVGLILANPDVTLRGEIRVDGEVFQCDGCRCTQSHYWGTYWAHGWLWSHCNDFEERPGVVAHSATVKLTRFGPLSLPSTFFAFRDEAKGIDFKINSPLKMPLFKSSFEGGRWIYVFADRNRRVEWDVLTRPSRMVTMEFTSPFYKPYWCHKCVVASSLLRLYEKTSKGWSQTDELFSKGTTSSEVMTDEDRRPAWMRFGPKFNPRLLDPYALREYMKQAGWDVSPQEI